MKILLVEDDEHKSDQVAAFLSHRISQNVRTVRSVQSAIRAINSEAPDLLILDMSLPVFDYSLTESGFAHLSFGGRDVLDHMDRRGMSAPVIVLTAFDSFGAGVDALTLDQLSTLLRTEYPTSFIGIVAYSALADQWQEHLAAIIGGKFGE